MSPTNWPITRVRCPKYRKKILVGKLATFVEQEIRRICEANTWAIGALNVQADHVHLFLSTPPSVAPSQIAHTLRRYPLDEMGYENLPEYLGDLVGYLGGPLAPEEAAHYLKEPAQQEYLRSAITV